MEESKEYIWNVKLAKVMFSNDSPTGAHLMINVGTLRYAISGFIGMYKIDDALKDNIDAYQFNAKLFDEVVAVIDEGVRDGVAPSLIIGMIELTIASMLDSALKK